MVHDDFAAKLLDYYMWLYVCMLCTNTHVVCCVCRIQVNTIVYPWLVIFTTKDYRKIICKNGANGPHVGEVMWLVMRTSESYHYFLIYADLFYRCFVQCNYVIKSHRFERTGISKHFPAPLPCISGLDVNSSYVLTFQAGTLSPFWLENKFFFIHSFGQTHAEIWYSTRFQAYTSTESWKVKIIK